ncbi:hypothetical protein [Veillonella sp.]|uniref:hypothetical protein n=1 Tax=Veillonella sp. TaxID=1926307 RepID=UPI0025ED0B6B|nr:hypothetical protein [Veillonella sp.]
MENNRALATNIVISEIKIVDEYITVKYNKLNLAGVREVHSLKTNETAKGSLYNAWRDVNDILANCYPELNTEENRIFIRKVFLKNRMLVSEKMEIAEFKIECEYISSTSDEMKLITEWIDLNKDGYRMAYELPLINLFIETCDFIKGKRAQQELFEENNDD